MAEKNLLQAIQEGLAEEMRADETVMVLGEDVGKAGGVFRVTEGLAKEFGTGRALDTPLAESLIVGGAIGLSVNGMRPVAEIQFADFIPPAFDQIVNEAARFYYRSNGAYTALEVARKLSEEHGMEVEVIEPRTLYPLDKETVLDSVKKTGKFLAISEANLTGSVSAEIAAVVAQEAFEWLDGPVMRLGVPDAPAAAFAKPMLDFFVPSKEKIEAAMLELARY